MEKVHYQVSKMALVLTTVGLIKKHWYGKAKLAAMPMSSALAFSVLAPDHLFGKDKWNGIEWMDSVVPMLMVLYNLFMHSHSTFSYAIAQSALLKNISGWSWEML